MIVFDSLCLRVIVASPSTNSTPSIVSFNVPMLIVNVKSIFFSSSETVSSFMVFSIFREASAVQ